jgi:hypothetical protein
MEEMDPEYTAIPSLQAIFDGAKRFGLTDEEVWQTVNESLYQVGRDATVPEYLDELTEALARRILSKERRIHSKRRTLSQELL